MRPEDLQVALRPRTGMEAIALGKEKYGLPVREKGIATNFIR